MATTRADVVFPPQDLNALLELGRFLEHHVEQIGRASCRERV